MTVSQAWNAAQPTTAPELTHAGQLRRGIQLTPIRTNDLHPAAGSGEDRQPEAVQLDDRGHEIESEAQPRCISDLVGAIETPLHGRALVFVDPAAGIGHAHDGFAVTAQQRDIHRSAFGGELDGVVDQIGDGFDQEIPVATHR
jgi:hypothetical protein